MLPEDLNRIIEQVGRDKGIDKEIIVDALEVAMLKAARNVYGMKKEIEAHYNEEIGEVELFEFLEVAEDVEDPNTQISLPDAARVDPEAEVGDSLGIKLETGHFGRISAQTAKQVIIQRVREAEREIIYNSFRERKGEIISGIVRRFERRDVILDLNRAEAKLTREHQIPRENYRNGDRVRCICLDIQRTSRGPQIILSRTSQQFLIKLFESEVPEIYEGIVEIVAVAREPGSRSKIAVTSEDDDVDPVGACVGMKGSRVQAVVQELRGEKIDIVPYSPDPARFVVNALAPADISQVIIDEERGAMEIIVPDDQLSLAIGRKGQNVRLAAQLTGWHIDISSESHLATQTQGVVELLEEVDGVGNELIPHLNDLGLTSVESIAEAQTEELVEIPSIGPVTAERIIDAAKAYVEQAQIKAAEEKEAALREREERNNEQSESEAEDGAEQSDNPTEESPTEESPAEESPADDSSDGEDSDDASPDPENSEDEESAEEDSEVKATEESEPAAENDESEEEEE